MTDEPKKEKQEIYLCKLSQSKQVSIPNDWSVKKIGNITKVNPEKINDDYVHEEISYIDIASIEDYEITKFDSHRLSERPSRAQRIIKKDDILISTVRPYLRGFTKIVNSKQNLVCSTGFSVLRVKKTEDIDFVYNYIHSEHFQINTLRHMEGLAYPAISNTVVKNSLIPYPKRIEEREKIGKILSNCYDLIHNQKNTVKCEEKFLQELIKILCVKGLEGKDLIKTQFHPRVIKEKIPSHWKPSKLQNVLTKEPQNGINIKLEDYGEGTEIIEIDSLYASEFSIETKNLRRVPISENELENYKIKNDDFLINRVSKVREGSGKLVIVKQPKQNFVFEGNIVRFHIDKNILLPEFLKYFSWTSLYKKYIQSTCKTATLTSIDQEIILNIPILIPPMPEQEKIISILTNRLDWIISQRRYLSHLIRLKRGLIQQLLTGQIRVEV